MPDRAGNCGDSWSLADTPRPAVNLYLPPAGALRLQDEQQSAHGTAHRAGAGLIIPATIDPGKPSKPGPRGQGRSAGGVLHLDPVGLVRSPTGRVDGDRMIRTGLGARWRAQGPGGVPVPCPIGRSTTVFQGHSR